MTLQKLLTRLILFCVCPLIFLSIFLAAYNVLSKQDERNIEASSLAKNVAVGIDQHLQARINALQMLAVSPLVDDKSRWKDLYREAQGFQQSFGSHIILADLRMQMLFNTRTPFGSKLPRLPLSRGRAAAPTALETGKPAVGNIVFGPVAKELRVATAVPILRKGKVAYLLLTTMEIRQFQARLDQVSLPSGWALSLLDGNATAIARRVPPGFNAQTDVDKAGRFVVKSGLSSWSVVLEIPRSIYRQPLIEAAAALAFVIFCTALISLLGGLLVRRRLAKAVASLVEPSATGTPSPDIAEIAAVRRLLDESAQQQRQANAKLQESEERYRSFFSHSIDAVLLTAPDGRIFQANPEACRIFGRTEEEICNLSRGGLIDPADPRLGPALEERERTGRFKGELNMFRKDGSSFPAEISSAVFADRDGNLFTSMIIRDMTQKKQAADQILQLNDRLQYLIQVVQRLSHSLSMEEIAEAVRTGARQLVGADGATFVLRDQGNCFYMDEDAMTPLWKGRRFPLERCISGWAMLHRETVIIEDVFQDDRIPHDLYRPTFVKSLAIVPIHAPDPYGAIGVYWAKTNRPGGDELLLIQTLADATAIAMENVRAYQELEKRVRERTSELAEANRRLQELDRLKSMFIASMSHELRTPLNSIIGFTGILLMGMSGELSAVQKKQLGMVKKSASHLLELINDVIDVSKIEAGKTELNMEAFDIGELVHDVRESFAVIAANKGLRLEWNEDGKVGVSSDRRRVRQILMNLVGNAVKFTESGTVAISLSKAGEGVSIKVRDTGVGMQREDMARLFEAFSRITIQGRPVVEGTGLGLYLSQRIAGLLGGEITAESEPGRGSEFTFYLPYLYQEDRT